MAGRFGGLHISLPGLGSILLRPSAATTRTTITSNLPPINQDGLLAGGVDVNGQQSKRIGPTTAHSISSSSIGAGISDSNDSSINPPTTTTLLHHQPFDNSGEMALTVVKPSYPSIEMNMEDYVSETQRSNQVGDYSQLRTFFLTCFHSYASICATFKRFPDNGGDNEHDPELRMDFLNCVYDSLSTMPGAVHKTALRSIVHALLEEGRKLYSKDDVRALFVLLQCPLFSSPSTYSVYSHLLRQILGLSNSDHHLFVYWLKTLEANRFRNIVRHLLQFISIRQFPAGERGLPAPTRSRWWIPTGVRILALLNASNNNTSGSGPLVSYTEFYNSTLDHIDLMKEYLTWQSPDRPGQFSYCQYPFILSIAAKRFILTKDSEQQMILTARRSLVSKMSRNQPPRLELFFLNIHVRRSHFVLDSLNEPDYGMFIYYPNARCYWFSTSTETNLKEYNLIGVLMGLAVYNSIILDLHFPSICYRKLLSPPVVPANNSARVGVVRNFNLDDLAQFMPEVVFGLKELLAYEGNVEEDMALTFQVSFGEYNEVVTVPLMENAHRVPVTNANRNEFVRLYLDWILNKGIYEKFRAFYLGFHSVCASNALIMLRPEEVEILVCGSPKLDLRELQKNTEYDGYKSGDRVIKDFWDVLFELSPEMQKRFLRFVTGTDRVPVGGMAEMGDAPAETVHRAIECRRIRIGIGNQTQTELGNKDRQPNEYLLDYLQYIAQRLDIIL
ncbi:probable E3 ubiquitin-protein ligase HECTD2 isoform X4 [Daphnia pulex]|uniref:probable E3 ubiquitin-protein ligase HECTD2 isoform X4 n=1 Tax=Daphnia pulex TaxID=6669 RepID=UPI001EDD2825|nr:probable E3 ubiquitin-protein ligase HECTD2 isoform X4 [Daphnia pulex]XP_046441620.1 probable E3 ubiquitin-protein ligase HECTD2 isoform X4 [Daphnia pulex]